MGYVELTPPLQALFDPSPMRRAMVRTTDRTVEALRDEVAERSPVAEPPEGAVIRDEVDDWLESRNRTPGSLKASWMTSDVEWEGPETTSAEAFTEDPIAPHVEWDTSPHVIRPVRATRLRFWDAAGIVFRQEVFHPGTRGQHMMRDSLIELETDWRPIGEQEMAAWAREQTRLVA